MAADAILMNDIPSGFMNENNLRFQPESKHGCVAHSIFSLEKIFVENIVVRHVTVVTIGITPVRTVVPCGILWRHDVTIHTSFRIIGQIRIGFAHIKQEEKQPDKDPNYQ